MKHKNFRHEEARPSTWEVQNPTKSSSDILQQLQEQATPRGPKQDYPSRPSKDFCRCKQIQLLLVGRARRSTLLDGVKCAASKKQKLKTFVHIALFRITEGFVLRNTIQLGTTSHYMQLLQYSVQEYHLNTEIHVILKQILLLYEKCFISIISRTAPTDISHGHYTTESFHHFQGLPKLHFSTVTCISITICQSLGLKPLLSLDKPQVTLKFA